MKKIKTRILSKIFVVSILVFIITALIRQDIDKINASNESYKEELIRFHVLANSDTQEDQELKLKVRDAIISYLQPKLEYSNNINESEKIITDSYKELNKISKEIIIENGYNYDVSVELTYSNFPTKQYSSVVLPAGEYKALKIVIGEGQGQNWWCVMFPPLCFVDESSAVIDKSTDAKLQEVLTEEEYELIVGSNNNEVKQNEIKFKILEIIQDIF